MVGYVSDCLTSHEVFDNMVCQLSPTRAQGGSGGNTLIGVLLLCHIRLVLCNIHIHNVTFDCGIETLYYYGGEPCID